ncbi:sensor histidine kinase [Nocardia cyriacigeorgica]|uniref:Sensor histidine kinase n=1 Tax=Nocardia cyriacigeorgica TaxID=135487 RepID=A0ABX0CTG3_9NOCA|nr:sensor histidine kinase [Nocardia cyriacigeorgica]NEW52257.1 sensor histidine kinase [Nocardia cyriacigeorgica]NEW57585.1 sensor histidine kinase [Nocardia cyriacigeorgica]
MHPSPLTPVVTTLRLGLHVLVTALVAVVVIRALLPGADYPVAVVVLCAGFLGVYFAGAAVSDRRGRMLLWLGVLTVLWLILVALSADAIYLAFGLFFLYLHLLPRPANYVAVAAATGVAVVGFGVHRGWSVAGVIGPVFGAAVAVGIALGYRMLFRESAERERLITELLSTRASLAEQERTAGKLAERERLAQEIHDTVAQGLSSIQLLLHAAEQAAPDHPALPQIRLARTTAAEDLAETRRLIAELTPAALEGKSLAEALERVCRRAATPSLAAQLVVEGTPEQLPMPIEAALVRIAQGAVANVVRHAHASRMRLTLTYAEAEVLLDVVDDGVGIAAGILDQPPPGSFGLDAMRRRVEQQGGAMTVESEPGHTAVTVSFPLPLRGGQLDEVGEIP